MKVLFDTNVHISRALTSGLAKQVVAATFRARWRVFVSQYILDEVERVLIDRLQRPPAVAAMVRRRIESESRITKVSTSRHHVPRDSNDDPILVTALQAGVDYLVTQDEDLLSLDPYEGIRIVTPKAYRELLRLHGLL